MASLVAQQWNGQPVQEIEETQAQSLGWEDPLGAWQPTSSILAWRIPRTGEPGGLQSVGLHSIRHN